MQGKPQEALCMWCQNPLSSSHGTDNIANPKFCLFYTKYVAISISYITQQEHIHVVDANAPGPSPLTSEEMDEQCETVNAETAATFIQMEDLEETPGI